MQDDVLFDELDARVEQLGFELVELERAGSQRRPILRLRVDRPASEPGSGVTLDDCVRVSRALEGYLDEREGLSERYVLEVSSPGVERPLVRRRDWERFVGEDVAIRGTSTLAGRASRLTGTLLGVQDDDGIGAQVRLRLPDGEEVLVPLSAVKGANLVFRWGK
jgi:ribosome maturation factor RimP